jgi:hypothetical protein
MVLGVNEKKVLDLLHFRTRVAHGLGYCGKSNFERKRGQPSSTPPIMPGQRCGDTRPAGETQYDGVDHLPWHETVSVPSRCKYPSTKDILESSVKNVGFIFA